MSDSGCLPTDRAIRLIACGLLLCSAARTLSAQGYFAATGTLDGVGSSAAFGVSSNGQVAIGSSDAIVSINEAFLWSDEGLRSLTPDVHSDCWSGISGNGQVGAGVLVVSTEILDGFRWTPETGAVAFGDLPGGSRKSSGNDVSARGDVVVGWSNSSQGNEAVRWTAEAGLIGLGDLPGGLYRSTALAVSADGSTIVGSSWSEQGHEAFRWTAAGGMVGLGDLPGGVFDSVAWAVSADGSVVVGNANDAEGQHTFRWTAQTGMVVLERVEPDEFGQRTYGTSWDGNVIVGEAATRVRGGAFYWTPDDGSRWLTDVLAEHGVVVPEGWHLQSAYAVSADGRTIVGSGSPPEGEVGGGWVAYLGPACRADYDDDGSVNTADVIAYLGAWSQRSIFADWNYDGYIDTRDVIGFLREWVAKPGCG